MVLNLFKKNTINSKKRIWIDGFEANVPQRLGSGQVAFELLKNIERNDFKNEYTILITDKPLPDLPPERQGWKYKILKIKQIKTFLALPITFYIAKNKPDIFFSPTHYIPRFVSCKRVGMIFDLSYLHYPEMFLKKDLYKLINWSKYTIYNASHIITISKYSKEDILKNYSINQSKITVAYPGYDQGYYQINDKTKITKLLEKYNLGYNQYILFLGTVQPRKNLFRLIQAMKGIDNLKLVIIGKTNGLGRQGWKYSEILEEPKRLGIEDKIIFTGYINKEDAVLLFNGAQAFILPSLYEGFGIPVADAMACGIPCIVSNVSSLPEVVGKAGLLINPESVDQIEQAIRLITSDKKLHVKLEKLSLKQVKKFSWDKMAKQVIKVFESL